jgi:p-aminobenzoyl-glutamate transporter AbgT
MTDKEENGAFLLKGVILATIIVIICLYLFITLYNCLYTQQQLSLTGNPTWDGLIIMISLFFSFAVLGIMYYRYVTRDGLYEE